MIGPDDKTIFSIFSCTCSARNIVGGITASIVRHWSSELIHATIYDRHRLQRIFRADKYQEKRY